MTSKGALFERPRASQPLVSAAECDPRQVPQLPNRNPAVTYSPDFTSSLGKDILGQALGEEARDSYFLGDLFAEMEDPQQLQRQQQLQLKVQQHQQKQQQQLMRLREQQLARLRMHREEQQRRLLQQGQQQQQQQQHQQEQQQQQQQELEQQQQLQEQEEAHPSALGDGGQGRLQAFEGEHQAGEAGEHVGEGGGASSAWSAGNGTHQGQGQNSRASKRARVASEEDDDLGSEEDDDDEDDGDEDGNMSGGGGMDAMPYHSGPSTPAGMREQKLRLQHMQQAQRASQQQQHGQGQSGQRPSGGPRRRSNTDAEREHKRMKRLLRNRVSAQQARERKKLYLSELEGRVAALEQRNGELEERLSTLQRENFMLRQVVKNTAGGAPS